MPGTSLEVVELGVLELRDAGLLDGNNSVSNPHTMNRKVALKTLLAVALGGMILPVVSSVSAPVSAESMTLCLGSYPTAIGFYNTYYDCQNLCVPHRAPMEPDLIQCNSLDGTTGNNDCCLCTYQP